MNNIRRLAFIGGGNMAAALISGRGAGKIGEDQVRPAAPAQREVADLRGGGVIVRPERLAVVHRKILGGAVHRAGNEEGAVAHRGQTGVGVGTTQNQGARPLLDHARTAAHEKHAWMLRATLDVK